MKIVQSGGVRWPDGSSTSKPERGVVGFGKDPLLRSDRRLLNWGMKVHIKLPPADETVPSEILDD